MLDASTTHLINQARLRSMKPDAVLVNAARGPVIDEKALVVRLALLLAYACADDEGLRRQKREKTQNLLFPPFAPLPPFAPRPLPLAGGGCGGVVHGGGWVYLGLFDEKVSLSKL